LIPECILLAVSYCVPIDIPRDFRATKPSESRIELSRPISALDSEIHAHRSYLKSSMPLPVARGGNSWSRGEIILSSLSLAASLTDAIQTQKSRNHGPGEFIERDPLARPFISRPVLNYTVAGLLPIGGVLLAHYLKSKGVRFWYIPQVVGIIGNGVGIGYTRANGFPKTSVSR
jgi:hypothetical protein